ncbi:hypothetical protein VNO78_08552 [Psophocarpus tetragonolobus]|uniref:Uncharacterized protein n=1 Tax=Psophocarpus tetragonolobus TaxID=3891 RepID=A0AAN9SVE2_PSOTE
MVVRDMGLAIKIPNARIWCEIFVHLVSIFVMELCLNKSIDFFFRLHDIQNLVLHPILQCPMINYTFSYKKSTRLFVPYTCNSNLPVCKNWVQYIQKKGFILEHEFKYIIMNFV